jgi:hypothetical protein
VVSADRQQPHVACIRVMAMRVVWLVLVLGCEPRLPIQPLPPLVATQPRAAIGMGPFHLLPGERMVWDVRVQGLAIGRADLVVGDHRARTTFNTEDLAAAFATVHYELDTQLAATAGQPPTGADVVVVNGENRGGAVPAGAHTFHTVLGWLRAWARPGARGGWLQVAYGGRAYQLEIADPVEETLHGEHVLRVDCSIKSIAISIWITRDRDAVPIRMQAAHEDLHVTADIVDFHVE